MSGVCARCGGPGMRWAGANESLTLLCHTCYLRHRPTCHQPMPATRRNGRPRTYCSTVCGWAGSALSRAEARARVDPVVVDRLIAGIPVVDSTYAERFAATAVLTSRGRTLTEIAAALHTTRRSISRYRKKEAA